jgi:hypothetical protein
MRNTNIAAIIQDYGKAFANTMKLLIRDRNF